MAQQLLPPKRSDLDYVQFIISFLKPFSCSEATRFVSMDGGVLVLDGSTLGKPCSKKNRAG